MTQTSIMQEMCLNDAIDNFDSMKLLITFDGQLCLNSMNDGYIIVDDLHMSLSPPMQSSLRSIYYDSFSSVIHAVTQNNELISIEEVISDINWLDNDFSDDEYNDVKVTLLRTDVKMIVNYNYERLIILTTSGRVIGFAEDDDWIGIIDIDWIGVLDSDPDIEHNVLITLIDNKLYGITHLTTDCYDRYYIGYIDDIKMIKNGVMLTNSGKVYGLILMDDNRVELIEVVSNGIVDINRYQGRIHLLNERGEISFVNVHDLEINQDSSCDECHSWDQSKNTITRQLEHNQSIKSNIKIKRFIRDDVVIGYDVVVESEEGIMYELDVTDKSSPFKRIELPPTLNEID